MIDPLAGIVGQPRAVAALRAAVERPVHAYLFVGPAGAGKRQAAAAFAAAVLDDPRALRGVHPDVMVIEREGASISVAQAREITRTAVRSPVDGDRKVIVLTDFHLVDDAAPALLKTIEEAPQSTIFVVLAEMVTRELVTVASRCVTVEFRALADEDIADALIADGVEPGRAGAVAAASLGSLDRARLLARDEAAIARRDLWRSVLGRLDGTGAAVASMVDDLSAAIDQAARPLLERQTEEVEAAELRIKQGGQAITVLKSLEARHKRELRRLRTDELRTGFATVARDLADHLERSPSPAHARAVEAGLAALERATRSIAYNPNEALMLQGMLVGLRLPVDLGA